MKSFYFILLSFVVFSGCKKEDYIDTFSREYSGQIDNKYSVTMYLDSKNGNIKGYYYYDKYNLRINLTGNIFKNSILINGYETNGKHIDIFSGFITDKLIKGQWSKPNSNKFLPFLFILNKDNSIGNDNMIYFLIGGIIIALLLFYFLFYKKQKISNEHNNNFSENLSSEKGILFEKYVTELFPERYYKFLDWTSDKIHNGKSAISNTHPDLKYKHIKRGKEFAIECNYRSFINSKISICNSSQLKRYNDYSKENNLTVFIVLGVGGLPNKPEDIYIIPLNNLKEEMDMQLLNRFKQPIKMSLFFDPEKETLNTSNSK